MKAQAVVFDQPCHSAYETFIEITNHLRGEVLSAGTQSDVEAYPEEDGRELLRLLLQQQLASRGSGRVGEAVCGADGVVRSHNQVLTFDGKGVVMRPEGLREGTRQRAEASPPRSPRGFSRQAKANRKRMATVAGIYHIERQIRCPRTVARQLAPRRLVLCNPTAAPKPVAKRLWASLEKPMKTVIEAGFEEGVRRDPKHPAEGVAVVDGDATPIDSIKPAAKQ